MRIQNCRIIKAEVDIQESGHSNVYLELDLGENLIKKNSFTSALDKDVSQLKCLMKFTKVSSARQLKNMIVKAILDDCKNLLGFGDPINDEYFLLDYNLFSLCSEQEIKKIFK